MTAYAPEAFVIRECRYEPTEDVQTDQSECLPPGAPRARLQPQLLNSRQSELSNVSRERASVHFCKRVFRPDPLGRSSRW
jgi:hypothetical protein